MKNIFLLTLSVLAFSPSIWAKSLGFSCSTSKRANIITDNILPEKVFELNPIVKDPSSGTYEATLVIKQNDTVSNDFDQSILGDPYRFLPTSLSTEQFKSFHNAIVVKVKYNEKYNTLSIQHMELKISNPGPDKSPQDMILKVNTQSGTSQELDKVRRTDLRSDAGDGKYMIQTICGADHK